MAYKLHELRIIPNGLNLSPPEDQVNESDSLILDGWWPSSIGKLQQTKGYTLRNTAYAAGEVHSIAEESGRVYSAAAGELYQTGRAAGASIQSGFDGSPLGLLGFKNLMWIMNRSLQKRDDGVTLTPWGIVTPAAPTSVNTTGESLPDGDYDYYVTWIDLQLYESQPGPALAVVFSGGTNDGKVTITQPAAPAAPAVFGWNVYRKSPGTFQIYKVNTSIIPIATTTYVDTGGTGQTVDDLIGANEVMEEDHQAPPAARVMADKTFNGRIIVANTSANPNRIYYTKADQPAFFPTDNYVDCGADSGDQVLHISVKAGMFIVYRQRSIWRQVGDFDDDNARMEVFVPEIGVVGMNAVAPTSKGDYFVGGRSGVADGVYVLTDWAQKVSQKIDPIFQTFQLPYYQLFEQASSDDCALGFTGGRLWFSYQQGSYGQTFILDVDTARWFALKWGYAFTTFYNGSQFFLAGSDGNVFSLEDGLDFDGDAIGLDYQTPFVDCGFPDHEKTWADLVITHHTQGEAWSVVIRTNNNRTGGDVDRFALDPLLTSTTLEREIIPLVYPAAYATVALRGLPIKSLNLSVEIAGAAPAGGFAEIHAPILLHYYLEARKGVSFDSGITNHGTPDVKIVDQVEIDIDASEGDAVLEIWSDLPGNVMEVRLETGITQTSGRQVRVVVLGTPVEGKLFRYQLSTTTGMQVYGFRARVLPIGVYVDGQFGEFWTSTALGLGA